MKRDLCARWSFLPPSDRCCSRVCISHRCWSGMSRRCTTLGPQPGYRQLLHNDDILTSGRLSAQKGV